MSARAALTAALAATLLLACSDQTPKPGPERSYRLGLYAAEQASLAEIRKALPALGPHRLAIMVALPRASFPSAELEGLLRDAAARGVEVRLWPLLPEAQGYWPNETNLAAFDAYVSSILKWLADNKLTASAIVYDMEPAITYSKAIEKTWTKGLGAAVALMRTHLDRAAHDKARAALTASVKRVQAAGLRAQCVTYPQVLDDAKDGDDDLQDALDIPVRGVPFDEVSFMVYQSSYAKLVGSWIGPDLIRVYAAEARAAYGDRGTIALGVVGRAGVMSEGSLYLDPKVLRQDVAAALHARIARVEVFSLDGMLHTKKLDAWLAALADVSPREPESSATVDLVQKGMYALDAMLDGVGLADGGADAASDAGAPDAGATDAATPDGPLPRGR